MCGLAGRVNVSTNHSFSEKLRSVFAPPPRILIWPVLRTIGMYFITGATAQQQLQQRNSATAQQRNSATAQQRNSYCTY